jgi:hypothetical protein
MTSYAIEWDGRTVTLPPAGAMNPDGVPSAWIRDEQGNGLYDLRLIKFADAAFAAHAKRVGSIAVDLVLIPRPDNPFDSDAVSIALPKSFGGDQEERCLGYLYRHTIHNWGIANRGRRDLVARLADLSEDGEVHLTAVLSRRTDPADIEKYRCSDDEEGWDIQMRRPELKLDLPKARIMGQAICSFLSEHEKDLPDFGFQNADHRLTDEEWARTPATQWLHSLRTDLVKRLSDEVIDHSESNHHRSLRVRRQGNLAVKVINDDGGCIGLVRTRPELVMVGNEFDRPAVVEALAREGISVAFDPTPGWLNASLQPESGSILVVWVGRIAGINIEPILASFDVEQRTLHVFAPELADPIERLLRRAGHVPQKVRLRDHPRDPDQLFGQDLIARLKSPRTVRQLKLEARDLVPSEWANQIEASWRAKRESLARNTLISKTLLFHCSPANRRPPDHPQLPPGLFGTPYLDRAESTADDASGDESGCRLCGEALNPYAEPSPYCLDCVEDACSGLLVDIGFDETWDQAVLGSLVKLATLEFGDAPARDQLRAMPKVGPNRDLLMLCRMLTARRGYSVPGSHRKAYSWTDWLGRAGLLESGIRTSRGVVVTAKDGHLCRSLLERQIDDFFFDNGIEHDLEPFYPFDSEVNPDGYRADWRLSDGTFVEALGFPKDPVYMTKAERKISLASRHQIPVVTVTESDLRNLLNIFEKWLPAEKDRPQSAALIARPNQVVRERGSAPAPNTMGRNATNAQARSDRLERCRVAVELQVGGAMRKQIGDQLGVSENVVPSLLRDGKFFANPDSDQIRMALAEKAAAARNRGLTRAEFRDEERLSNGKADECWRDADVLFSG